MEADRGQLSRDMRKPVLCVCVSKVANYWGCAVFNLSDAIDFNFRIDTTDGTSDRSSNGCSEW